MAGLLQRTELHSKRSSESLDPPSRGPDPRPKTSLDPQQPSPEYTVLRQNMAPYFPLGES